MENSKEKHLLDCRNIARIASRAQTLLEELNISTDRLSLIMDIEGTNDVCPLDLDALHNADRGNFLHDITGIYKHFNRVTLKLDNGFVPRYALRAEKKKETIEIIPEKPTHNRGVWLAKHSDPKTFEAFGTDTIPTPYFRIMDKSEVVSIIQELNPEYLVY